MDSVFQFARIQEPRDWFWPILVLLLLLYWIRRRYVIDGAELKNWQRYLLLLLRTAVAVTLLIYFLHPQWERIVGASRVAILVDSSASMSTRDREAEENEPTTETSPSRMEKLLDWMNRTEIVDKLREKHDVVLYRFDESLQRMVQIDHKKTNDTIESSKSETPEIPADGAETRLGESLRELLQRERGQPLSGVLLLSDGGLNSGEPTDSALELAKNSQIPIYTIGFGLKQLPLNYRILHVDAPDRAFPDDPFKFKVQVELQGNPQAGNGEESLSNPLPKLPVELWIDNNSDQESPSAVPSSARLVGKQEIDLKPGTNRELDFEVKPETLGKFKLFVKLDAPKDDRIPEDNLQTAVVEVVDRKDRVLLFAGGPLRDYQFLCNQLYRDKSVQVDVFLPWASPGISQSADKILDSFPNDATEMSQYDCIVAFDPDWRVLSPKQVETLEHWVARLGGGLIVVAGPVNLADTITGWPADPTMDKIRAMYPVDVSAQRTTAVLAYRTDSQPWPLKWERSGEEAEFLRPADTETESRAIWSEFPGFYSFFLVRGLKPTATLYAKSSSPDAAGTTGQAALFAEQYYGAGRVFYVGSGEIWRLRMIDDTYFEKIYTKLIRHVSQGRLQQRSQRGSLAADKKKYSLGSTATIRATVYDPQFKPLVATQVFLDVIPPDAKVRRIPLEVDPNVPGSYSGFVPLLLEGNWTLKLQIPETSETLTEVVQARISDLESENPSRNEPLLEEIAQKTDGEYFETPYLAVPPSTDTETSLVDRFAIRSQQSVLDTTADEKTRKVFLYVLCSLLCVEWTLRRLMRLA